MAICDWHAFRFKYGKEGRIGIETLTHRAGKIARCVWKIIARGTKL